jgi:MbtH protein
MPEAHGPRPYAVVVNDEEQYSIWPAGQDLPAGWRLDGFTGPEEECLAHIEAIWTDMRPASLRRWMREHEHLGAE